MRRCLLALFMIFGACARVPAREPFSSRAVPSAISAEGTPIASPPSIIVEVYEVVTSREKEAITSTWIYAGGRLAGKTSAALKSVKKRWEGRLKAGNHPLRFQRWRLVDDHTWIPDRRERQPKERFVRVLEGMQTRVMIKYYDGGRKHEIQIKRAPMNAETQ